MDGWKNIKDKIGDEWTFHKQSEDTVGIINSTVFDVNREINQEMLKAASGLMEMGEKEEKKRPE